MNWIKDKVLPKFKAFVKTNDNEDNLSLVNNNADFKEQLDGNEIDSDEFATKVSGSIFFHS